MDNQFPNVPTARTGSPETAFDAAASIAEEAKNRENLARAWLRSRHKFGGTADETAEALGWDRYSSRPRLSMLRARGEIVDSGQRRKGVSGKQQAVWVAPEYAPGCPLPQTEGAQHD